MQLEQEMDLILKRSGGYRSFQSEWKDKWAPAILQYSRHLKRKEIKDLLDSSEISSDEGYTLAILAWCTCNPCCDVK